MKRLSVALATLCTAALAHAAPGPTNAVIATTLEPQKIHEECLRLEPGEQRRYHWKSDAPVDFNIHYHRGAEVIYPVKRDGMRGDGGTFTAKTAEDYCWMWSARMAPARIEGAITKKNRGQTT